MKLTYWQDATMLQEINRLKLAQRTDLTWIKDVFMSVHKQKTIKKKLTSR